MRRPSRIGLITALLSLGFVGLWCGSITILNAQATKTKPKPAKPVTSGDVKQIDARLEKLQETFLNESAAIVDGYERSGQFERAKSLLEIVLKLDPNNESIKKHIADCEKQMLERTEFDRKFDATAEWTLVGHVRKDRPLRIEANGDYRLNLVLTGVKADGFPSTDVMHDLQPNIPTGALMGMIVTEENTKDKKPGEPFAVKSKYDFTPKQNGDLYLKLNVPPGAKCSGDLKLKLSGIVRPT